jgi:hypothetical protein
VTPRVVLEYVGEGESARIVQAEQEGRTGYFQVVHWVDDGPVWKGEHLEWLAADLDEALRSFRHPWPQLHGFQVAPEAHALVKTILAEQGVAWDHWWAGSPQTAPDADVATTLTPGADMTLPEPVLPTPYATDLLEYLSEEGFRPKLDEDADVYFKYEGATYVVIANHGDATILTLLLPYFWPLDDAAERTRALEAAMHAQKSVRIGRVTLLDENVSASVNAYLPDEQSFRAVLLRSLEGLHYLAKAFRDNMRAQMEN